MLRRKQNDITNDSCSLATLVQKDEKVHLTVVCSLVFSIAAHQCAHRKASVGDPNVLILAFQEALRTVGTTTAMVTQPLDYFRHAWYFYRQVVKDNGINIGKLEKFFSKIESDGEAASN